jgi:polar amino acid transport system permease protein
MESVSRVYLGLWLAVVLALLIGIVILTARLIAAGRWRRVLMSLGTGLAALSAGGLMFYLTYLESVQKFLNEFMNWDIFAKTIEYVVKGLNVTVRLAVVSEAFILVVGLFIALLRISRIKTIRTIAAVYIDVIRGMPLLLQIFIVYFGLGFLGINLSQFTAGVLALTICYAAYEAEIFRAGIESIHKGQMEAARSLGMGYLKAMRYIVLPQAVRNVIPPLSNEFIALLKDTALVATIGLAETFFRGREMMGRYANVTPLMGAALCYLVITLPLMRLVQYMTRRLSLGD